MSKLEDTNTNPQCPDCGNPLHTVSASTPYGTKIKLDQCTGCGGIWFDSLELYPIPKDEVERMETIELNKLQENKFLGNGSKLCPKCEARLQNFKDMNFPKTLEVENCPQCGGIWMNKGEAVEFKKWQEEKKRSIENPSERDREFNESIKGLLEVYRDKDMENIGKAGKLLSMKLDPHTMRPLNKEDYGTEEYNKAYDAASVAISIFYMLLRLFLKI